MIFGEVEITYRQLLSANASGAIGALLDEHFAGQVMPMAKFGRAIMTELEQFQEARKRVIERNGGTLETAGYETAEGQKQADIEFNDLLSEKVTLRAPRFTEAEIDNTKLTGAQAMQLGWLIEESS
jgi:hypothetical protein